MKKLYVPIINTIKLLIIILLLSCSPKKERSFDSNDRHNRLQEDIISIFKGEKVVLEFQEVEYTQRYELLEKKFKSAVQINQEWFLEYQKKIRPGEKMPYHTNLGLSKSEYEEFSGLMNNLRFVTKSKHTIGTNILDSIISIKAPSEIELFNSLSFNLKDSSATLLNQRLKFDKEIKVKDSANAWKQSWTGYQWSFSNPEKYSLEDFSSMEELQKFSAINYKVFIGQLDKTKEHIMNIRAVEIANGAKTMNLDIYIKITADK